MLIAQGVWDGIVEATGELVGGFVLLFLLVALKAIVVMIIVTVVCAASAISLVVHGVVTATRLAKQRYRAKGPGLLSPLLTLPGIVIPAMALVVMLKSGVGANDGIPLVVFMLSMGVLLFVWFAPWEQHVRAMSEHLNVGIGAALGQVISQNRGRFLMTIGVPLLLVIWVSAAIRLEPVHRGNGQVDLPDTPIEDRLAQLALDDLPVAKIPDAATVKKHMTPAQLALGDPAVNSVGMLLVPIPAGEFQMGSPASEAGRQNDEIQHVVKITKPFYLGVYEVTQQQYAMVMGSNPSYRKGSQNPVEQVSWNDAVEFCRKLSELPAEKSAGYVYRLPTEAEWEYACRAGTTTKYSFGDSESELGDYAWYGKNSGGTPHPVGQKKPNGWGLYDMHGNVSERCEDWHGKYPSDSTTDPTGASSGTGRVVRGGGQLHNSDYCRSANRRRRTPDARYDYLGFRVLRSSIDADTEPKDD